jgi:uncharacterized membrane protein YbhN (UPF0104 family)
MSIRSTCSEEVLEAIIVNSLNTVIKTLRESVWDRFAGHPATRWVFKIVVTALFVVIVNRSITLADAIALAGKLSPGTVATALLFSALSIVCQVRRWTLLLEADGFKVVRVAALRMVFVGHCLAFLTPGRFGELFRGVSFAPDRRADVIVLTIVDKLFNLAATLCIGCICVALQVALLKIAPDRPLVIMALVVAGVAVCLWPAALLCRVRMPRVVAKLMRFWRLWPLVLSGSGGRAALWSLAAQVFLVVQTGLLLSAFGAAGLSGNLLAAGQAFLFMMFLPFFIGNMGIREYSFGHFLQGLSLDSAIFPTLERAALGASIVILVVNLVLPALVGLFWMVLSGRAQQERRSAEIKS